MKRLINIIYYLSLGIFIVTFTLLNTQPVTVSYYFGTFELDLLVVIVICFALGILIGVSAMIGKILKMRQDLSASDRKLKMAEKELENLRSLPLKDDE